MKLNDVHDLLDLIIAHERGGWFDPARKDMALDASQIDLYNKFRPPYGMNQVVNEALAPFKRLMLVTNSNSPAGLVTLPEDYDYLTSVIKQGYDNKLQKITYQEVDVINDDELGRRLRSQLRPVTVQKPVAQYLGTDGNLHQLLFHPNQPTACRINYLKRPQKPVYEYDQDPVDERKIVYKPLNSKQLEWRDTDIYKVIDGALAILGINLDEDKVIQYSQMKTAQQP